MKMKIVLALGAAVAMTAGLSAAQAGDYTFTFSGEAGGTFTAASSPTDVFQIGPSTNIFTGMTTAAGFSTNTSEGAVAFYESPTGGFSNDDYQFTGDSLFTGQDQGPNPDPMFKTGSFTLTDAANGATETLVISDAAVSAAPEPGTWTLMLGGVAAMGLMLRRRRMGSVLPA